jgi:hypothetical protein
MNSRKYDLYILARIQDWFDSHEEGFVFMQDNASIHRSYETQDNLRRRRIPVIVSPLTRQTLT